MMLLEKEAQKIIGKKHWESFCKFMAADQPKITVDTERTYDPEKVALFCRLRGIPLRAPNQGKSFNHISTLKKRTGKTTGRPQKKIEWDFTSKDEDKMAE